MEKKVKLELTQDQISMIKVSLELAKENVLENSMTYKLSTEILAILENERYKQN